MKLTGNKWVWILVSTALAFIVAAGIFAVTHRKPAAEPALISPSATPTPTVTPSRTPLGEAGSEPGEEYEKNISDDASQPFVTKLPHTTPYWSLSYGGKSGATYVFRATVYYRPNENPQSKLEQQKPYVLNYLRSIGQPEGSYTVNYATAVPDTY